jgi:hypothetical protein
VRDHLEVRDWLKAKYCLYLVIQLNYYEYLN